MSVRAGSRGAQSVVLICTRNDPRGSGVGPLLDHLARSGCVLHAVLDPHDWREAFRMLADGAVDIVLAERPEDLPGIAIASRGVWPPTMSLG
jgi:hypothetical protein